MAKSSSTKVKRTHTSARSGASSTKKKVVVKRSTKAKRPTVSRTRVKATGRSAKKVK